MLQNSLKSRTNGKFAPKILQAPCGTERIFRCLIDVTYSALPKYADNSQNQDLLSFI
jgi:hypothetical protein